MGEAMLASAAAEVLIYNEASKQWQSPDGIQNQISNVQILQNHMRNTFRMVAVRENDGSYVLNCNIPQRLKYHAARTNFHQWRDEQRQVFGLNFSSEAEARQFLSTMGQISDFLNNHQNEYQVIGNDAVYQDPQHMHSAASTLHLQQPVAQQQPQLHHMTHNQSAPVFRDCEDGAGAMMQQPQMNGMNGAAAAGLHPNFRKSSHSVQSAQINQSNRRASQGSNASSSNGSNGMYGQIHREVAPSPSRTAPPAPPAPPMAPSSAVPPAPQLPPIGGSGGAPPPPPPGPPPPNLFKNDGGKGLSLADQLKNAQLRKTNGAAAATATPASTEKGRSMSVTDGGSTSSSSGTSRSGGGGGFLAELTATFNKKKMTQATADAADSKSNISNEDLGSSDSGTGTIPSVTGFPVAKKWDPVVTDNSSNGHDSPKTHRKAPSGSSISSQEEPTSTLKLNGVHHNQNGTGGGAAVTTEMLDRLKADLMVEVRLEINKAKKEIIEAIRAELSRK